MSLLQETNIKPSRKNGEQPLKIDILVGNNSYSSVTHFSRALSFAFQKAGVDTRLFFCDKERFYKAFYAISNDPPDMTLSFSNITIGGHSLSSKWKIPHFSYLLDPGIYYLHQLEGQDAMVSCVDRKDIVVMQALKSPMNPNSPFFLPHGVDVRLFKQPKKESIYDIVMLGTCHDIDKIRDSWSYRFSPEVKKFLDVASEMVLSKDGISCYEALQALCKGPELQKYVPILHAELDVYITGKERIDLLRSLNGLSVHIFGKGPWKKYLPNASVHPQIPFTKTLKVMQEAKIVLNSSSRFKDGSHERIFTAFASHSLPLTSKNPFLQDHFQDQTSILFYPCGNYNGLKDKIAHFLEREEEREEIVNKGRTITLNDHTWDSRVNMVLTYLSGKLTRRLQRAHKENEC